MTAPITIDDYGPSWPAQFQTLRARIAAALDGLATAIGHVGSTAVPGLAAKPILDIDVLSRSAADLPLAVTKLASLGYEHQGDLGTSGREAFPNPALRFPASSLCLLSRQPGVPAAHCVSRLPANSSTGGERMRHPEAEARRKIRHRPRSIHPGQNRVRRSHSASRRPRQNISRQQINRRGNFHTPLA